MGVRRWNILNLFHRTSNLVFPYYSCHLFDLTYDHINGNMTDKLVKINPKDFPALKLLYTKDESNNFLASMVVTENYI